MEFNGVRAIGLAILMAMGPWSARSQQASHRALVPPQSQLKTGSSSAAMSAGGELQREFDDPHFGNRWLLMRDPSHPGGPGLMVPVAAGQIEAFPHTKIGASPSPSDHGYQPRSQPAIHVGDRLIVEESTALVEARLEAVALGPAQPGASLNVRLIIGGNVVRVVALGPGHASFAPIGGARP
jgi:hypothetical protein